MRSSRCRAPLAALALLAAAGCGSEAPIPAPLPADAGTALPDAGAATDAGAASPDAGAEAPDAGACAPASCAALGAQCGEVDDGCGRRLDCGGCPAPSSCGAEGEPNRCGCVGETEAELCAAHHAECGELVVADCCGRQRELASCGVCEPPTSCASVEGGQRCVAQQASWRWELPLPTGARLAAIAAVGPDAFWAAGAAGQLVHASGGRLEPVEGGTHADLLDLWASGPSDVWAAGDLGTLLHFDGSRWSPVSLPTTERLVSVCGRAAAELWVLPEAGDRLLRFDGESWSVHQVAGLAAGQRLTSVRASAQQVLAVGTAGALARWDGAAWSVESLGTDQDLGALFVSGQDAWVAGATRVWAGSGSTWQQLPADTSLPGDARPLDLRAWDADEVWTLTRSAQGAESLVHRWDGSAWSRVDAPAQLLRLGGLDAGHLWAAGERGQLVRLAATGATQLSDEPLHCHQLWAAGSGAWARCTASDSTRQVRAWSGSAWLDLGWPADARAGAGRALWAGGADEVLLATSRSNKVYRFDGQAWADLGTGLGRTLNALGGAGGQVWLAGERGYLWHLEGTDWQQQPSGTDQALFGLWFASDSRGWAVGDQGVVLSFDGTSWSAGTVPTTERLTLVHGSSAQDVWIAGKAGVAFHWDGQGWSRVSTGTADDLSGLWVVSPTEAYALTLYKLLLRWDGTAWSEHPLQPLNEPQAIGASPSGELLSLGDGIARLR